MSMGRRSRYIRRETGTSSWTESPCRVPGAGCLVRCLVLGARCGARCWVPCAIVAQQARSTSPSTGYVALSTAPGTQHSAPCTVNWGVLSSEPDADAARELELVRILRV